jgi:hypothetical protein
MVADQIPQWLDSVGPGWTPLLLTLDDQLKAIQPNYQVVQMKEKFGGLRIYLAGSPAGVFEEVNRLICTAEGVAERTCEFCGRPGIPQAPPGRSTGWVKTACDECQTGRGTRR